MISLIIPTTSKNKNYTQNILNNIREIYPNENEIEIIIEENDNVTLGINYNNAVVKAKGEKIILLHNDMILKPGFIETMDKHISKNRITTYTRIEPSIFLDTYPGKIILDCGDNLENFNKVKFNNFHIPENLINGGSQLFFGCLKEDYLGIDGKNFKMFCEDDDLHLRYKIMKFEHKVSSANVYHFVSKTSRNVEQWDKIEFYSNKNFIRKWGFRRSKYNIKYDIGFRIQHCNLEFLEILEPWCSNILIDDEMQVLISHYIDKEQKNTSFDLSKKIKTSPFQTLENEIIIYIDRNTFTNQDFQIIQNLSDIIKDSGEIGKFQIGNLIVEIKAMNEYQTSLIKL